jgi:hypothetical protein
VGNEAIKEIGAASDRRVPEKVFFTHGRQAFRLCFCRPDRECGPKATGKRGANVGSPRETFDKLDVNYKVQCSARY